MAVRKETIKQQFTDALPAVLEPGEQVQAGTYLISGPSPMWVAGIFGLIGMLVYNVRYYYLAVTDRRVIFYGASSDARGPHRSRGPTLERPCRSPTP